MVKELQQQTVKVGCLACNGSLNSYDSYSCPVCQGAGFVEVMPLEEEVVPPMAVSQAEAVMPEGVTIPKTGSIADGYDFLVEHL
jgi:hypothetical protein